MKEQDPTEPAVVVCERDGAIMVRTYGMGAQRLTVIEAKALRRGLSRAIREATAQEQKP